MMSARQTELNLFIERCLICRGVRPARNDAALDQDFAYRHLATLAR